MSRKLKLLIVEDEEPILRGLVDEFESQGYIVDFSWDGEQGLSKARQTRYDLILLDVMLPSRDGFSVLEAIRLADRSQPVIMLTAKDSDDDRIMGLSLGADDYVSKPFSLLELVLRVEAVLRRSGRLFSDERKLVLASGLVVDPPNLEGRYLPQGMPVEFTRREVEILQYLHLHEDRPVSRGELLVEVWGYPKAQRMHTRTVDIHIAKLRRKLESDAKNPRLLVTVRGQGYRLMKEQDEAEDLEQAASLAG